MLGSSISCHWSYCNFSESCEDLTGTSDYLEAVHTMDQEDIRCLMPQPRDLHDFCSTQCVAMEIYPDSHLQGQDSDKTLSISDLESKMSHQEEEEPFHLSPSESDREILQRSVKDSSEAKIEELQQDQLQSNKAAAYRELIVERHFKVQARQITAIKRKKCDSWSTDGSSNSSSAPKQAKKNNTATKKKPPPATKQAVHVLTAETMSEAVKEVKDMEIDDSEEGVFQATLSTRGWESKNILNILNILMWHFSTTSRKVGG
jgi:hypothetical protein